MDQRSELTTQSSTKANGVARRQDERLRQIEGQLAALADEMRSLKGELALVSHLVDLLCHDTEQGAIDQEEDELFEAYDDVMEYPEEDQKGE